MAVPALDGVEARIVEELAGIRGLDRARATGVRRVEAYLDPASVRSVFQALLEPRGIIHLSAISGMDTGKHIVAVYHAVLDGVVVSLFAELDRKEPRVDTVVDLIPGASSHEREVHDLLGIDVRGNHNMKPLVLPDDWPPDAYPLRKDFKPGEEAR